MRISVNPKDKGFRSDARQFKVTVDGILVARCITADDDLGMVVRYKTDDSRRIAVDGGAATIETVYGRVKINRKA
jgi:hypothetical protein